MYCGPTSLVVSVLGLFFDRPKFWAVGGTSIAAIYCVCLFDFGL
jgi:hypothetical protein